MLVSPNRICALAGIADSRSPAVNSHANRIDLTTNAILILGVIALSRIPTESSKFTCPSRSKPEPGSFHFLQLLDLCVLTQFRVQRRTQPIPLPLLSDLSAIALSRLRISPARRRMFLQPHDRVRLVHLNQIAHIIGVHRREAPSPPAEPIHPLPSAYAAPSSLGNRHPISSPPAVRILRPSSLLSPASARSVPGSGLPSTAPQSPSVAEAPKLSGIVKVSA